MSAYENYENRRKSAEVFKSLSAPLMWFAVGALIVGLADLVDGQDREYLGWVRKNLGWEGTLGIPALLLASIVGIRWRNNLVVREAGKAAADEGLAREGRE
ncbi:MAG: hypothetical protein AAB955_01755 [Patescibacteria group bacterium]